MKVSQLKQVLECTADMYRDSGRTDVSESLLEFASLCKGREKMTVAALAKLIDKSFQAP